MNYKGLKLDLWGKEIYLVPIEIGTAGNPKRAAITAIHEGLEDEVDEATGCKLVKAFYKTLLVQNYPEQEAEEIADSIPEGWAKGIMELAKSATLPPLFIKTSTQEGRQQG